MVSPIFILPLRCGSISARKRRKRFRSSRRRHRQARSIVSGVKPNFFAASVIIISRSLLVVRRCSSHHSNAACSRYVVSVASAGSRCTLRIYVCSAPLKFCNNSQSYSSDRRPLASDNRAASIKSRSYSLLCDLEMPIRSAQAEMLFCLVEPLIGYCILKNANSKVWPLTN